jgi:hypothetical protein
VYEIIAAATNVTALAVIGFIYAAYIKNLRSVNQLKDSQLKISEQNLKLWKDKALGLERRAPEFIEKQLSERIKIREEEISRLAQDSASHVEQIDLKNREIQSLRDSIEKATEFRKSITVWDSEEKDFIEVSDSDLEQRHIGSVCVDTASLMICDPWYPKMTSEMEKEEFQKQGYMYQVINSGEYFCTDDEDDPFPSEFLGFEEELTAKEMVARGLAKKVAYNGNMPAIKSSYIGGGLRDPDCKPINHLSFVNGRLGAGISISIGADGVYPVYIEYYKDEIQRIIISA